MGSTLLAVVPRVELPRGLVVGPEELQVAVGVLDDDGVGLPERLQGEEVLAAEHAGVIDPLLDRLERFDVDLDHVLRLGVGVEGGVVLLPRRPSC